MCLLLLFLLTPCLAQVHKPADVLDAIASQGAVTPLRPHYDTRYVASAIEVGEVFQRPLTVESRARAQRALEINRKFEERQAAIQEASLLATKKDKKNKA
jgi:hypothetical protein